METRKCKVVMLATDDDCNLTLGLNNLLVHHNYTRSAIQNRNEDYINQHLYILSDEEIKEGDWFVCLNAKVLQAKQITKSGDILPTESWGAAMSFFPPRECKKIISTTDFLLGKPYSKDNMLMSSRLPQPSQSFTKKYVTEYNKDNIITEVLVEYENVNTTKKEDYQYIQGKGSNLNYIYKPKLTKENTITIHPVNKMYSKEEVEVILENYRQYYRRATLKEELQNWIKENYI